MKRQQAALSALILLSFLGVPAGAAITWTWSFQNEAGIFKTNGDLAGGFASAGSYTIDTKVCKVTSSSVSALDGRAFTVSEQPQGFEWDGERPLRFWRSEAVLEDDNQLTKPVDQNRYTVVFEMSNHLHGVLVDPDCSTVYAQGALLLIPEKSVHLLPAPGTLVLACTGAGLVIWMRRHRRL